MVSSSDPAAASPLSTKKNTTADAPVKYQRRNMQQDEEAQALASRFRLALKHSNITRKNLSDISGVTYQTVSNWFSGRVRTIPIPTALRAAAALNVSPVWLRTGRGEMTPEREVPPSPAFSDPLIPNDVVERMQDVVSIPTVKPRLMGADIVPESLYQPVLYPISFFLKQQLSPPKCQVQVVEDEAMAPLLNVGDSILVDTAQQTIVTRGVYVFFLRGQLWLRRLTERLDGTLLLQADNALYSQETLPADRRPYNFRLVGRVVEHRGTSGLEVSPKKR